MAIDFAVVISEPTESGGTPAIPRSGKQTVPAQADAGQARPHDKAWHGPQTLLTSPMSEPQTAAELIQQGLVHHRAGQISLAMDRYTQVLRDDPRNADALYYIAVIACHERQYQHGIDLARRSLSFRPRQARAHNLIGQALHRMGKIKDALENFDNAIECDTNFADAYSNR